MGSMPRFILGVSEGEAWWTINNTGYRTITCIHMSWYVVGRCGRTGYRPGSQMCCGGVVHDR